MKRSSSDKSGGPGGAAAGAYGTGGRGNGGYKKMRSEADYEDEMQANYDEEALMEDLFYEKIEGVEGDDTGELQGRWIRPKDVTWSAAEQPLIIHWLDIDMISGNPLTANPAGGKVVGSHESPVPIVRLFGVTREGFRLAFPRDRSPSAGD